MPKPTVFIVIRDDYEHSGDKQTDTKLISAHASLTSANAAAKAHLGSQKTKGRSAQAGVDEREDGTGYYEGAVVVAAPKRYQSVVKVTELVLEGGQVTVDESSTKTVPASKKGSTKASASSKKRKEKDVEEDDEADEDEGEPEEVKKKPSKPTKGASKKSKNESRKPETAEGSPDCLQGLQFVISGVLEGFTRDEAKTLVINRGGKVLSGISKNVDYVILGANAGPKKLDQIADLGLKTLDFDGFNELIKELSS